MVDLSCRRHGRECDSSLTSIFLKWKDSLSIDDRLDNIEQIIGNNLQ